MQTKLIASSFIFNIVNLWQVLYSVRMRASLFVLFIVPMELFFYSIYYVFAFTFLVPLYPFQLHNLAG